MLELRIGGASSRIAHRVAGADEEAERRGETKMKTGRTSSFGRALKDAGITNFRFHDLRHTFASHYMVNRGQLYALLNILGHEDLKITQHYAKLSPE